MKDLKSLVAFAEKSARNIFKTLGTMPPCVFCRTADGNVFGIGWNTLPTAEQRRAAALAMGGMLREKDVVQYVVVTEAWTGWYKKGEAFVAPSKAPDRGEAVFIEGYDAEGNEQLRVLSTDRSKRKPQLIVDKNFEGTEQLGGGTYSGLLDEPDMPSVH